MTCAHLFVRRPGWWRHRASWLRWECVHCGYLTRAYDGVNRMGTRSLHRHMSVALPGYNATTKRKIHES